jgi:hypothetical protein
MTEETLMRTWKGPGPAWRLVAVGLAALAAAGTLTAAAGKAKLTSPWRDRDIRVDGIGVEWSALQPLAKNVRLAIGLANDAEHLYIALVTSDAATSMQMLQQGLIVWFDAKGGKKRQFGIRYPMGMTPDQQGQRGGDPGRASGGRSGGAPPPEGGFGSPGAPPDVGKMYARAEADGQLRRLEILGEGKDTQIASIDSAAPLELKTGWSEGTLVYELKIPLARNGNLPGLGVQPGAIIGIGLETPKRSGGDSGGMRIGGPGGMGGGMGGRGGGMPGGRGGGMGGPGGFGRGVPGPLKLWTTLLLSPAPSGK